MSLRNPETGLAYLPLEILEACISASDTTSWLSLASVSKIFHSLTTRSLYRDISLGSPLSVIACCHTLLSNSTAASSVRTLLINHSPNKPAELNQNDFSSYYASFRDALKSLVGIRALRLLVEDPSLVFVLKDSVLPRLQHFECRLILSSPLISFLNRHPTVNYLEVSPHEDIISSVKPTLPPLYLPELEYFAGNGESLSAMSPPIPLRAAFLSWGAVDSSPEVAIAVLERHSGDSLNVISCRRRGWNLDLVDMISTRLPYIYSLHITNILVVDSYPTEAYLEAIWSYLKRFKNLQRLVLNCVDVYGIADLACRMDVDFLIITSWGEACPSLMEISLPHSGRLSWHRITENFWIPDIENVNGSTWLYTAIISDKYPGWHTLVNKAEKRIHENLLNPMDLDWLAAVFHLMERRSRCDFVVGVEVEEAEEVEEDENTSKEFSAGDVNEDDVDEAV
ncbi:hypothetical protein K443DRAFT_679172 [Laccaria amethystina LaAM-08-1]|uniref:Unplaced genomic scaffold K443scaffold_90, whole genome shotgun sequence n=1 Tax=Laccaria amethystina LaAM-08-1 TaxID=1095629 RepID=A0A0C9XFS0_9AGAR|nr:hypothetical protein K443DRAFT_679172 [Laccaria amethystina LaAM-08-1]